MLKNMDSFIEKTLQASSRKIKGNVPKKYSRKQKHKNQELTTTTVKHQSFNK